MRRPPEVLSNTENSMQTLLAELVSILRQEIDQYRGLHLEVRRERGRIVRGELAGLVEVVRKKQAITRELAQLEAFRSSLLDRLAEAFGVDPANITLARVATLAPGEIGETLHTLLIEFRGVIGLLMAASDVNRTLLDRSLEFVQGSLEIFRTVATGPQMYGSGGRFQEAAHSLAALNQTV
jgi:flagellar biosynthesis/type III secretory pathway chaperone